MTDWYKIKRVLIWQNWTEKQIYPAGWKPWANTVAYWTLDKDYPWWIITDESWNWRELGWGHMSWYANPTIATLWWVNCFEFTDGWYLFPHSWDFSLFSWKQAITISVWVYITQFNWWAFNVLFSLWNTNHNSFTAYYDNSSIRLTDYWSDLTASAISLNTWLNLIFTAEANSNTWKICVNGVEQTTSWWVSSYAWISWSNFNINRFFWDGGAFWIRWYMSNFIIENIERSAAQKLSYYNQTKWNYGL